MNCRPNELAFFVSAHGCYGPALKAALASLGRVVKCLDLDAFGKWNVEPYSVCGFEVVAIDDSLLRPIRDPGDDAVDEISLRRPITRQPEHC
jgi:hypothetical protein